MPASEIRCLPAGESPVRGRATICPLAGAEGPSCRARSAMVSLAECRAAILASRAAWGRGFSRRALWKSARWRLRLRRSGLGGGRCAAARRGGRHYLEEGVECLGGPGRGVQSRPAARLAGPQAAARVNRGPGRRLCAAPGRSGGRRCGLTDNLCTALRPRRRRLRWARLGASRRLPAMKGKHLSPQRWTRSRSPCFEAIMCDLAAT